MALRSFIGYSPHSLLEAVCTESSVSQLELRYQSRNHVAMISDYGAHRAIVEHCVSSAMHKAVVVPLVETEILEVRTQTISNQC